MHALLSRLLLKRGIESPEQLTPEEKTTFDEFNAVLSKQELTLEDIKVFCQSQLDIIDGKWNDFNYQHKADLVPYHTVYKNILAAIDSPRSARIALEKHLTQLTQ